MKLSREEMLANMGSRDASLNGKYIIGVHSTGIYCLPSCPARIPKPENVKFYANGAEAEAAGLRPCKKCKPDAFERGEDRELSSLETLVSQVRENPANYGCVPDLADAMGIGATKIHELVRAHYHTTPADLLAQARLEKAKARLLASQEGIAQTAYEVGFESLSVFNDNFKKRFGLTPSEYRGLPEVESFVIQLPLGFNVTRFLHSFGRDRQSPTERVEGRSAILVTPEGSVARLEFSDNLAVRNKRGAGAEVYETLYRVLGFSQDPKSFEQLVIERGYPQLVQGREGSRIPQTYSLFDGLLWAIVGQQINLPFAFSLRRRFYEKCGEPVGDNLFAVPSPERVANLDQSELIHLQFSQRKAEYVIGVAKLGVNWLANLERMSATTAFKTLTSTRGLGVWSTNYVLMRALGFADCVPYGDTGLAAGLIKLNELDHKPDVKETEALMEPFAPYRSFATFHLWQSLK